MTGAVGVSPPGGRLRRVLASGATAVAVEVTPPVGPSPESVRRQIDLLAGYADAYNVTDNQSARVHASSLVVSTMLRDAGLEPVLQLTCRDRNRLGLQSDLIGAALAGITNVVALSGDHPALGDHPHVRPVADVDSMNLLRLVRRMRDERRFESGREIPGPTADFFIGAVVNPFSPPLDYRPYRLAKKVVAGAQFVQTQLVFNLDGFREYMARVVALGLHEKVAVLAGVGLVRSLKLASYLRDKISGIDLPDPVLERFTGLSPEDQEKAGFELCCETCREVLEIEGVRGLHLMSMGRPERIADVVRSLGLHPRPEPAAAPRGIAEPMTP